MKLKHLALAFGLALGLFASAQAQARKPDIDSIVKDGALFTDADAQQS